MQRCLQNATIAPKKKKNQPIPTFFHLSPLSPFTIKPHLPPSFSLKIQNPPIPTPLLISALSQLTSSNFFFFFFPLSPIFRLSSIFFFFFSFFHSSFATRPNLFFSLPFYFDFISLVLFVVVLMLVGFGFENDVAAS